MYCSYGNYEAFTRPKEPGNVESKFAYLVESGLASLTAACFLIKDGQMKGSKIHILEELPEAGGSLDGEDVPLKGYIVRGGHEMESHFECSWNLSRSTLSLEIDNASVLGESYWLDKEDPNYPCCRVIGRQGQRLVTDGDFTSTKTAIKEILDLCLTNEEDLDSVRITDVFSDDFFNSNSWIYWKMMFAFEPWHSAVEMHHYLTRFAYHISGLADFSALEFTRYSQYESLILSMVEYLKPHGIQFEYDIEVEDVRIGVTTGQKIAQEILIDHNSSAEFIKLTINDLVFVTNGSITGNFTYGGNDTPAPPTNELGGSQTLWKNLARQSPEFGSPNKFCQNIPKKSWFVSAISTTNNKGIIDTIESICKRDPLAGKTTTGSVITINDFTWQMSFTINRQQWFKDQPEDEMPIWIYVLYSDVSGDYIEKPITECSGNEICQEWLYHLDIPTDRIEDLAKHAPNTTPVYMSYITSYFTTRAIGDRPSVVPRQSQNLTFIGNFTETERGTIFTIGYSVRAATEAVYQLLDIDHGIPEVVNSPFDPRVLVDAIYELNGHQDSREIIKDSEMQKLILAGFLKKIKGTYIESLLKKHKLL